MTGFDILKILFFSLSFPLVTLMIRFNPSGHPAPGIDVSPGLCALLSAGTFIVSLLLYGMLARFRGKLNFLRGMIVSFLVHLASVITLAILVHRDYFTIAFQILLIYSIIFISRKDIVFAEPIEREGLRYVYRFSLALFILVFFWLCLMGYAISTRQEPRWIESIFYNIYNAMLLIIMYFEIIQLRSRLYRRVVIGSGRITIDRYDFTSFLGEMNLKIVTRLARSAGRNVRCSDLMADISQSGDDTPCSRCVSESAKATLCPRYKTLYNRILDIKKLFESLEIGTVIYPENKMRIIEEGWKLRLFDDIRLEFPPERKKGARNPEASGPGLGKTP